MQNYKKLLLSLSVALAITGCSEDPLKNVSKPVDTSAKVPIVKFNPSEGVTGLPIPTDILFSGSLDGSLNIPILDDATANNAPTAANIAAAGANGPLLALNTLDGFSTTSPIVFTLLHPQGDSVDSSTLTDNASTPAINEAGIRVFEASSTDPATKTVSAIGRELKNGVDFAINVSNAGNTTTVAIVPTQPLAGNTTYLVVVTNTLKTTDGTGFGRDVVYNALHNETTPIVALKSDNTTSCAGAVAMMAFTAADAPANCEIIFPLVSDFKTAFSLDRLRLGVQAHQTVAAGQGISVDDISLTFSFSTQNIGSALIQGKLIAATAVGTAIATETGSSNEAISITAAVTIPAPTVDLDGAGMNFSATSYANIRVGSLNNIPQMIDPSDATASTTFWQGDPAAWADTASLGGNAVAAATCTAAFGADFDSKNLVACNGYKPKVQTTTSIPLIVSVPNIPAVNGARTTLNGGAPNDCPANLPITIYQHGITSNRATILALANSMALQCQVVVAIDMPQHGINSSNTTFAGIRAATTVNERIISNADGEISSGSLFINLQLLPNARDTYRQAVVDLHSLSAAVKSSDYLQGKLGGGISLDESKVGFLGMSLGGIVGMSFLAHEPDIKSAVINVAGGGIAKLLDGSFSFGPTIAGQLAASAGITRPSSSYEQFFLAAQTIVDGADPINLVPLVRKLVTPPAAAMPGDTDRGILFQMVAGSPTALPDQTVPNNVFGLPNDGAAGSAFAATYAYSAASNPTAPDLTPATYNPANTVPGLLSGSDPLVRGTAFLSIVPAAQGLATAVATPTLAGIINSSQVNSLDTDNDGKVDSARVTAVLTALAGGAPAAPVAGAIGLTSAGLNGGFLGLNLSQVSETGASGTPLRSLVRFNQGTHGSLLDPSNLAVTTAMQTQASAFLFSEGTTIPDITSPALGGLSGLIHAPLTAPVP